MPGKNVALSSEAVEVLDRAKKRGESYSDVVLRLAQGSRPLQEAVSFLQGLEPVDDDSLDRVTRQMRRAERQRAPRRARI